MANFNEFVPMLDFGEGQPGGNETTSGTNVPADGTVTDDGAGGGFFTWSTILIWGLVIVAMWFMLIRPQRKREKEVREMQSSLKVGDNVVTTSGFFGKIVGTGNDAYLIEFGENRGLNVWVRKTDIAGIKSPVTTAPKATEAPAAEAPRGLFGKKKDKE